MKPVVRSLETAAIRSLRPCANNERDHEKERCHCVKTPNLSQASVESPAQSPCDVQQGQVSECTRAPREQPSQLDMVVRFSGHCTLSSKDI